MKVIYNEGKWNEWTRYTFGGSKGGPTFTYRWLRGEKTLADDPDFDLSDIR
jgi:hypothetical protein